MAARTPARAAPKGGGQAGAGVPGRVLHHLPDSGRRQGRDQDCRAPVLEGAGGVEELALEVDGQIAPPGRHQWRQALAQGHRGGTLRVRQGQGVAVAPEGAVGVVDLRRVEGRRALDTQNRSAVAAEAAGIERV